MKLTGNETGVFSINTTPTVDPEFSRAKGGTELMKEKLYEYVPHELLNQFNIISTRVRHIDNDKPNILWMHDTWDDPENEHLSSSTLRKRFKKIVFVSNYQFQTFHLKHGITYDESAIIKNAIVPIPLVQKSKDVIKLIYHTTPHRGLRLLLPVYDKLYEEYGDKIHLDVYSSFQIYGWKERDKEFEDVFEFCKEHPGITYHGTVSNDKIREALQQAHIFAFPSIWPETFCIAAVEAMSAGCMVVCPNYAALPEITSNFAVMYPYSENMQTHANRFYGSLKQAIENYNMKSSQDMIRFQKSYIDSFYNWDIRSAQWSSFLKVMLK